MLSPKKSGTGHRLYRRKDVELLLRIKHLLYEKRFTIEGARQTLQKRRARSQAASAEEDPAGIVFRRPVTRNTPRAGRHPGDAEIARQFSPTMAS